MYVCVGGEGSDLKQFYFWESWVQSVERESKKTGKRERRETDRLIEACLCSLVTE